MKKPIDPEAAALARLTAAGWDTESVGPTNERVRVMRGGLPCSDWYPTAQELARAVLEEGRK